MYYKVIIHVESDWDIRVCVRLWAIHTGQFYLQWKLKWTWLNLKDLLTTDKSWYKETEQPPKHQGEMKDSNFEHKSTIHASYPRLMQDLALLYWVLCTFKFSAQFQVSHFSPLSLILTLSKNVCKRIPGKEYLPSIFHFTLCNTGDFEIFIISQWIFFLWFFPLDLK